MRKVLIRGDGLATIGIPLQSRTIRLRDIQSLEVYGKSIVPSSVSAILLSVAQILFLAVRGTVPVLSTSNLSYLILLVFNVPILLCVLVTFLRAKCVTLRVSFQSSDRAVTMRFVPRSVAEDFVSEYSEFDRRRSEISGVLIE
jgi:hypothetical protein